MTNELDLARIANLAVPRLLSASLAETRSIVGSEQWSQAQADFNAVRAELNAAGIDDTLIMFAAVHMAMMMVDQLSVAGGSSAEAVIEHFARTYRESIPPQE